MRFSETSKITLSDDNSNQPKQIRFQQEHEDVDVILLKESLTIQQKFAVGTHSINMGGITQGKFLFIKGSKNLSFKLNSITPALVQRAQKFSKMWVDFSTLEITTTEEQDVIIVIAGE